MEKSGDGSGSGHGIEQSGREGELSGFGKENEEKGEGESEGEGEREGNVNSIKQADQDIQWQTRGLSDHSGTEPSQH